MTFVQIPLPESHTKWTAFLAKTRAGGLPINTRDEKDGAMAAFNYLRRCIHFADDTYHVAIDAATEHAFPGMSIAHLSIKRHDRAPIHDWRELQRIKNELVGRDVEAIELFPNEARVVDTANQYHLYAFLSLTVDGVVEVAPMIPVGFTSGSKAGVKAAAAMGALQRPFDADGDHAVGVPPPLEPWRTEPCETCELFAFEGLRVKCIACGRELVP